jgi:outer membrane protein
MNGTPIRTAIGGVAVLLLLLLPPEARAQEAEPRATRSLTLEEALEIAGRNSPGYRQARNEIELAAPEARVAAGRFLPALTLNSGTNQSFSRFTIAEDIFGNPVDNPNVQTSYTSGSSQGLQLGLTLFGGARNHRRAEARADAARRVTAAEVQLTGLTAGVERSFFEAQHRRELLALEEELLGGREMDLEATRRLFSLASRSRTDVLGAELELSQQERAIQDAGSEYRKALLALRNLLGDPDLGDFTLAPAGLEIFDPAALDPELLVSAALERNPRVRTEEARVDASRAQLAVAGSSRWPTVSVSGGVTRSTFGPDQSALFDVMPRDRSGGNLSLNVSFPLFQRFEPGLNIARAEISLLNARESLRQTGLDVEEAVRARLIDLDNAFRALDFEERSRALAEERLRLTREEYRLAGRRFEDLQGAVRAAADARRRSLAARYAFVQARVTLEETVGMPLAGLTASPRAR